MISLANQSGGQIVPRVGAEIMPADDPKAMADRVVSQVRQMAVTAQGLGKSREFEGLRTALEELARAVIILSDKVSELEARPSGPSVTGLFTPKRK